MAYPFDIIKKRAQVAQNFTESNFGSVNITKLVREIYTKEGFIKGFYKGITVNFIKVSEPKPRDLRVRVLSRMELHFQRNTS